MNFKMTFKMEVGPGKRKVMTNKLGELEFDIRVHYTRLRISNIHHNR